MSKKRRFNISVAKFASLVLRHNPKEYQITVDSHGFAKIENVLAAISLEMNLGKAEILKILHEDEDRFVFENGKIASRYGHSIDVEPICKPTKPPKFLYHGTSHKAKQNIEAEGLKSMKRKFVHLSRTIEDAKKTGKRKDKEPIVIEVFAKDAYRKGIKFYNVGPLYLSEDIPSKFLNFYPSNNQ